MLQEQMVTYALIQARYSELHTLRSIICMYVLCSDWCYLTRLCNEHAHYTLKLSLISRYHIIYGYHYEFQPFPIG